MKWNHWQKNIMVAIGLFGLAMLPAGCGNSLDDQFVFGKNRIHCNGATITVATPFEMASDGKLVDLADKQASKVNAEGHNGHIQILVTGNQVTSDTNEANLVASAEKILQNNSHLKNLQSSKKDVTIGNVKGTSLSFQFTEEGKGKATDLSVEEYIFTHQNTVWRVIYQYRSHDEVGKALASRLAGQIALGSTF